MAKSEAILAHPIKYKGWLKEPPSFKDYVYKKRAEEFGLTVADKPSSVVMSADLSNNMPDVGDQGDIGSCTGWAVHHYAIGYLRNTDRHREDTDYSPLFGYYHGRVADGMEWEKVDAGAYIRDVVDTAAKIGACPESKWPYAKFQRNWSRRPPPSTEVAAKRWRLGPRLRCEGLEDILSALSQGRPVVLGFIVHTGMQGREFNRTGVLTMPNSTHRPVGGHAVCVSGYNRHQRVLWGPNSWGTEWAKESPTGRPGYWTMPFDMAQDRRLVDDVWALVEEA